MKFVSKAPKSNYFWVEDYTESDKTFFESLGFKEIKSRIPKAFGGKDTLNKQGTGKFGLWRLDELKSITNAIHMNYPTLNRIDVQQDYND